MDIDSSGSITSSGSVETISSGQSNLADLAAILTANNDNSTAILDKLDFVALSLAKIETILTFSLSIATAVLVCYILYAVLRKFL